jgi:hypothetical protein
LHPGASADENSGGVQRRGEAPTIVCGMAARKPVRLRPAGKALETIHHRPRYPGFPVEVGGVVILHAVFLTENRTRGSVWWCVTGNSGYAGANLGHPALRFGADSEDGLVASGKGFPLATAIRAEIPTGYLVLGHSKEPPHPAGGQRLS